MSLIDSTYFTLDTNIPDSDFSNLTEHITRYEKEILIKLFGYELYLLVAAYVNPGSTQAIIDLVEGVEYTVSGVLKKWNGLVNSDKKSLISYYVYYWWVRNHSASLNDTGVMQLHSENATPAKQTYKMVTAWREMFELYYDCIDFLNENSDDYPAWVVSEIENLNQFDI